MQTVTQFDPNQYFGPFEDKASTLTVCAHASQRGGLPQRPWSKDLKGIGLRDASPFMRSD